MTKQFYICASKIEGLGVNAGEEINAGELITKFKGKKKFLLVTNKKESLSHPNWVGVAKNQWIDPEKPQKFINHSCNPNASIKGRLSIVALRKIKEGEEITFDYSVIEGDQRWEMKCLCGEKNCRGLIKSIHFLPKKQFTKYMPYVPTYFKNLYQSFHSNLNENKKR